MFEFLVAPASLVAEQGLSGAQASAVSAPGLNCSTCGINLPGSRIEPVSPALAGGFFTTEPTGKP